ncbi:16S rRNA (cytosine1402-N4)-methyltransferase [Rubricella aquisinus]|uniref:Ribosomal RNA small subunit methyltransferase H n=1 Tax=Rubricella aquisinus TaxID=2028108 RepID=A0A840X0C0_9RHOB|nr:16S rRNA (cytosine(1402)-N(4))-methyltransferase RsmH [Rubricella aquisinus]MBB5515345.1 16S rRNA (cytosine1402-N4)-methyltransferase [Rubricella aquisinus]
MTDAPHIPVLLDGVIASAAPVGGVWLDGTLGAGGYTRALLDAGAETVIGVDRDPDVIAATPGWADAYGARFTLAEGRFGELDALARAAGHEAIDGVVLDIGVSSMQIDQAMRGFSFQKDGPLDMRMSQTGPSAADLVNTMSEAQLADVLFQYGEERASRRIARKIVEARKAGPITTTGALVSLIESCLPRPKPHDPHPATRSFQGLRIAVNGELRELFHGLAAAERILAPGGKLIVVSFHSLEDRIVKRFFQLASGRGGAANRHAPITEEAPARFDLMTRRAVVADDAELSVNPRARSAKLRAGTRTDAPALRPDPLALGLPRRDVSILREEVR